MSELGSYEDAARDAANKVGLLPSNEGKDCPPFRSRLYRLAEATHEGNVLPEELRTLLLHTDNCPACGHTYGGLLAFMRATPRVGAGSAEDDFLFEGTPIRELANAAKSVSFKGVQDRSAHNLFRVVCEATKLTEAAAIEALGMDSATSEEEMLQMLEDLGVPREVLGLS